MDIDPDKYRWRNKDGGYVRQAKRQIETFFGWIFGKFFHELYREYVYFFFFQNGLSDVNVFFIIFIVKIVAIDR